MSHLFVSDLHLDAASPDAIDQFVSFLHVEARGAESLYILGDLFEAWIGDDDPDPHRRRVCEALAELTSGGTPCFVQHGNRDFLLGTDFGERTGCRLIPDPTVTELYGTRVLITHGDLLCTGDYKYQELRSIVRDPDWQRRYLALPLADRTLLANEARAGSRAHTGRTVPVIMDADAAAVEAAFRACDVRWLVHGHTHRPGVHASVVDGEPRTRIVLGAWYEHGSALEWRRDGHELKVLRRPHPHDHGSLDRAT